MSRERFRFRDTLEPREEDLWDVLAGACPGTIVRNFALAEACTSTLQSVTSRKPIGTRDDDVPGLIVGAFHFGKELDEYLDEVGRSNAVTDSIASSPSSPWPALQDFFSRCCNQNNRFFRRAAYQGRPAGLFAIRRWIDQGAYLLKPHEDAAQRLSPAQTAFEVSATRHEVVCAVNLCLENESDSRLTVWNIQPDENARSQRGIEFTGYPYDPSELEDFERLDVEVRPGDLYFFDARNVHAVTRGNLSRSSMRTTMSFMCALTGDGEVISWT